ncbi:MAG: cytochrome c1 [Sulfuricellaceae bacterium]|nr:cytochrome c1 [Sulfuricellaceae bacterium]
MKKLLLLALLVPSLALANEEGPNLDQAHYDLGDQASLQRGAKVFVNYCLSCHSANYMRYSRLEQIGLSEKQIKENLLFAGEKVGETMNVALNPKEAKGFFGATPPDLSVIARSRGADWLYTYLRGFYRDDTRPTGWNNTVFDKVGMPHVLYQLQGEQVLHVEEHEDSHGVKHEVKTLVLAKPGTMKPAEYDALVGDLVNYLVFMGEPAQQQRKALGIVVLLFLGLFFVVAYYLKKEYWKDIH